MNSMTFVLFGATGDLAKRKIYQALYNLYLDNKIPDSFSVIGLGRREWTNDIFQSSVEQSLESFSRRPVADSATMEKFLSAFHYHPLYVGDTEGYKQLL